MKLEVESNGTVSGTKVFVDGKQIGYIGKFSISVDSNKELADIVLIQKLSPMAERRLNEISQTKEM